MLSILSGQYPNKTGIQMMLYKDNGWIERGRGGVCYGVPAEGGREKKEKHKQQDPLKIESQRFTSQPPQQAQLTLFGGRVVGGEGGDEGGSGGGRWLTVRLSKVWTTRGA